MSEFTETDTADAKPQLAAWNGKDLPPGARGAMMAMLGALGMLAVPYLVTQVMPEGEARDTVSNLRAWVPGDPVPFAYLFEDHKKVVHVDDPTGGGEAELPDMPELVVVTPDLTPPTTAASDVDAGAAVDAGTAADVVAGEPSAPGVDAGAAPEVTPPAPVDPITRIKIPPETWEGLSTFIEDPNHVLSPFYEALGKAALKTPGVKVHIAHWGDSAIAADGMTGYARRLLQRTFGDGGHGYAMLAAGNPWYRRKDIDWTASGWQSQEFIRDQADDGRYGFGGGAAVGYQGSRSTWKTIEGAAGTTGTAASEISVFFLAQKNGGKIDVKVDGALKQSIDTATADGSKDDRVETITVPDGAHTFEVKNGGGGQTKVYGVAIERDQGLVYDGLGVVGARDTRWLQVDADHLVRVLAQRGPDLSILMYGGNALVDSTSMDWYREKLTTVVRLWRKALPTKACLLMSPIDHGEKYRGRVRTVPRQLELMKVQHEVALAEGCAWFSIYDAMGGDGAIGRWYDNGLANSNLAHPTGKGSAELGTLWYKALMKGFADFIDERAKATP